MTKRHPTRIAERRAAQRQRGATLFELLLVTGVIVLMLAIGSAMLTTLTRQSANQMAANQILTVQRAAEEFVKSNFAQLIDPLAAGNIAGTGAVRVVTIADLSNGNYLPAGFAETNMLNLRMRIWLRNDTLAAPGALPALQVITATESGGPATATGAVFEWVNDTALYGNGKLGVRSNLNAPFSATEFSSTSGTWEVPLAQLTGYSGPLPGAGADPRAYLASYGRITNEDVFDTSVLYRIPVAGHPEYNQMNTDLNMQGFDVIDVGTVTADRMTAAAITMDGEGAYALTTNETLTLGGPVTIQGDTGGLTVFSDNDSGTVDLGINGNVSMAGGATTVDVLAGGNLTATGQLVTSDVTATRVTTGDLVTNDTASLIGTNVTTSNLQLGNSGGPSTLIANNSLSAGGVIAAQIDASQSLSLSGGATHKVYNNMRVDGSVSDLPSISADSAYFNDLCYTSGGSEGVSGC